MKTNEKELVMLSVIGQITSAVWPSNRQYRVGADGVNRVVPGTGGICYTHFIGDTAINLKGDHVEPGISLKASNADENSALNTFSCVGNLATVVSGDAKGAKGVVCGTHGGVEHVMVDFAKKDLEKMTVGDKIQVRSFGTGLEFLDFSKVKILNSDPSLIRQWGLKIQKGKLHVSVSHIIPAKIMGSGLGATSAHRGDYDIQMFDESIVDKYDLNTLRFGDLVAIMDADHSYGYRYLEGAVSIGVIVHSKSDMSGHGPGVTTLLTSPDGLIHPVVKKDANIGELLSIGRWRR
jgi:Domain of unknown function (DUF4438)